MKVRDGMYDGQGGFLPAFFPVFGRTSAWTSGWS